MIIITLICLGLLIVASISDGTVEGFEFDGRKSFERKAKRKGKVIDPKGFWGSKSHQNKDTWWYKVTGGVWDFYHLADDVRKHFYILPSGILFFVVYGLNLQTIGLVLVSYVFTIFAKRWAMEWIRK